MLHVGTSHHGDGGASMTSRTRTRCAERVIEEFEHDNGGGNMRALGRHRQQHRRVGRVTRG